ncbi:MAG TPA: DUF3592 domain-containing protein [Anaerohalosphaeraceae bacterium]|jgi:hypothetical protein|nr:DUF3592 domain-containing protein [Anaerohalosphaeraceae bacterium]HRT50142.1 DUF3592 domain-containing protein [Anaerohalosphaeraceae bacterium]HRT86076.1 DUF3592 domain-containing protein [Anaerohalosphaeraceae bacterium]
MKFHIRSGRRNDLRVGSRHARPLSSRAASGKRAKAAAFIVFGMFTVFGFAFSYFFLVRPVKNLIAARSWVETPCTILSANVKSHSSSDGTTYSVDITYEYRFGNRTYTSDRYNFMGGSSSGRSGKQEVVDRYRKAKNPVCYVDPHNPQSAVLVRKVQPVMLWGLFPVIFILVGVAGVTATLRGRRKPVSASAGKDTAADWLPETRTAVPGNVYAAPIAAGGPVVLKAKHSRASKVVFLVIFAVLWNGIVSIPVTQVVKSFQRGRPEWGLTLFISIFVLVGLAVIVAVVHQFLAMFNPKTQLTLNSASIPLGGAGYLKWEILGAVNRISELIITLTAREECRYRRGTKTYTDKNTFFTFEIARTTEPVQMAFGEIAFAIPSDTMHSFEATNNKIIWSLHVKGDIKRWPDLDDQFDITITPAES